MKRYISFCKKLNHVMLTLGAVLLVLAVGLTSVQILTRNFSDKSFTWADELIRYIVIYAVYLASGTVFYIDANARVDIFYNMFPRKIQGLLSCIFYLLIAGFLLIMGYYGYLLLMRNLTIWCASIHIPWAIPFASLVIGAVNMLLQIPAKLYSTYQEMIAD